MIRVTVEFVPFGQENKKRTLCVGTIVNTGTGTPNRGNYRVTLYGKNGQSYRTGKVIDWPRKTAHPWSLVSTGLWAALSNLPDAKKRKR